jgi:sugar-specific transcriptional regulator TrmB
MLPNVLFKSLIDLGVSEFEAKVYQYLLDKPTASVSQMAIDLSTNRVRIYDSFKKLQETDLLDKTDSGLLSPAPPTRILSKLRFKETQTRRLSTDLEEVIPDLLYQYNSKARNPTVKIYEGKNNFIRLVHDILEELEVNSELLWLAEGEELYDIFGNEYFNQELGKKRFAKGVKAKILANPLNKLQTDMKLNREVRYLPKSFQTPGTIMISGAKIVNWNTVIPKVIMIEDVVMAKVYTQVFDLLWDSAEIREV